MARGVHPLATARATTAAGVDLDRDAIAHSVFVYARPELDDRAHELVTGREVLVERQLAFDQRRRAVADDLEVRRADGDGVDPYQDFGQVWVRHRLGDQ